MNPEQLDRMVPSNRSMEFLAGIAPVLGLDPDTIYENVSDAPSYYQTLVMRAEQAILASENPAEQRIARLSTLVLKSHQHDLDLARMLTKRNYQFDPKILPDVVDLTADWLCNNLVELPDGPPPAMPSHIALPGRKPLPPTKSLSDAPGTIEGSDPAEPIDPDDAQQDIESGHVKTGALQSYLNAIQKIPLLRPEEEPELGKTIEIGLYAAHKLQAASAGGTALEPALQKDLNTLVEQGAKARERFISANLRLVVRLARNYRWSSLSYLDVIQEGNMGLVHAVEMYDYTKGYKFSTYARWWIIQSMVRGIQSRAPMIRVPFNEAHNIQQLSKAGERLSGQLGREPRIDELAKDMNMPQDKIRQLIKYKSPVDSLDRPVSFDSKSTLGELISATQIEDQEEAVLQNLTNSQLRAVLHKLNPREKIVLKLHYSNDEFVHNAVCKTLGVHKAAAKQLLRRTLSKLAHPAMGLDP